MVAKKPSALERARATSATLEEANMKLAADIEASHKARRELERRLADRDETIDRLHKEHTKAIEAHRGVIDLLLNSYSLTDGRTRTVSFDLDVDGSPFVHINADRRYGEATQSVKATFKRKP